MEESIALLGILKYAKTVIKLILKKARSTKSRSQKDCKTRVEKVLQNASTIISQRRNLRATQKKEFTGEWLHQRQEVVHQISETAEEIRKIGKGIHITQIVAASMDIFSSIVGIVGVCLAPFSMVASFVLLITALGLSVLGESTSISAQGTEMGKLKSKCLKAKEILDRDTENMKHKGEDCELSEMCDELSNSTVDLTVKRNEELITVAAAGLEGGAILAETIMYVVAGVLMFKLYGTSDESETKKISENLFFQGASLSTILLGVLFYVIGMGMDVWAIVQSSVQLWKGSKTSSSTEMLKLSQELLGEKEHIQKRGEMSEKDPVLSEPEKEPLTADLSDKELSECEGQSDLIEKENIVSESHELDQTKVLSSSSQELNNEEFEMLSESELERVSLITGQDLGDKHQGLGQIVASVQF